MCFECVGIENDVNADTLVLSAIHQVQFLILDMYTQMHTPVITPTL